MATKQDPPKKMKYPKGTMTPPSRKNMLEGVGKAIKKSIKQKPRTGLLKKALTQGDQSSAAQTFSARAKKGFAMSVGKAFKSDTLKNALSKGDKSSASQAFKSMVAKKVNIKKGMK